VATSVGVSSQRRDEVSPSFVIFCVGGVVGAGLLALLLMAKQAGATRTKVVAGPASDLTDITAQSVTNRVPETEAALLPPPENLRSEEPR
jgi:hypothetical protein